MFKRSKEHLASVNESYFQHMGVAFRYGAVCMKAGLMALAHGLVPAWFETTASETVSRLADKGRGD